MQELSQALHDFAIESFTRIYNPKANTIYSPYSLFVDISMAACISKGETFRQIKYGLRVPNIEMSQQELAARTHDLTKSIERNDGAKLPLIISSNGVWANSAYEFNQEDFRVVNDNFDTKIVPIAFPQPACRIINETIEKQTNGLIKDLLDESILGSNTKFVLTNSAYFKAKWAKKFEENETQYRDFTSLDQRVRNVLSTQS